MSSTASADQPLVRVACRGCGRRKAQRDRDGLGLLLLAAAGWRALNDTYTCPGCVRALLEAPRG